MKWKKIANNYTLSGDGFYISYVSGRKTDPLLVMLTELGNSIKKSVGDDKEFTDGEETALCKDGEYFILTGDWRKEYEKAFPKGYEACLEIYKNNKEEHSNEWSTDRNKS